MKIVSYNIAQYFKGKRVIVIGDFNCFIGQKDESLSRGTLLQISTMRNTLVKIGTLRLAIIMLR